MLTLATDGVLTAVTIPHHCKRVWIFHSSFERNPGENSRVLSDVNKLQLISHVIGSTEWHQQYPRDRNRDRSGVGRIDPRLRTRLTAQSAQRSSVT